MESMDPLAHHRCIRTIQAKTNLKRLEETHEEHAENATKLSDDLQCLSEELDRMKKNLDGEATSVSDATPLTEIRAAIQCLRKENKELDVYLGVLVSRFVSVKIRNLYLTLTD